jgi:hypothetical protein
VILVGCWFSHISEDVVREDGIADGGMVEFALWEIDHRPYN